MVEKSVPTSVVADTDNRAVVLVPGGFLLPAQYIAVGRETYPQEAPSTPRPSRRRLFFPKRS